MTKKLKTEFSIEELEGEAKKLFIKFSKLTDNKPIVVLEFVAMMSFALIVNEGVATKKQILARLEKTLDFCCDNPLGTCEVRKSKLINK